MNSGLLAAPWLEHWYLLPVGVAVAAISTSSGLAGSNFWIPIYLRGLGLEPRLVFWMSLATMVFGFGSGVARNLAAGTIDWSLARRYGAIALPVTAVAAVAGARAPQEALLAVFAVFALLYGLALLFGARPGRAAGAPTGRPGPALPWLPSALAAGTSQGLIATGAGTFLLPSMLGERKGHHARAVGASVALVFACTLIAVGFRLDAELLAVLRSEGRALGRMLLFAAPGVVVGGQLGPRLAQRIPERVVRPYVGALLVLVSVLVASRVF